MGCDIKQTDAQADEQIARCTVSIKVHPCGICRSGARPWNRHVERTSDESSIECHSHRCRPGTCRTGPGANAHDEPHGYAVDDSTFDDSTFNVHTDCAVLRSADDALYPAAPRGNDHSNGSFRAASSDAAGDAVGDDYGSLFRLGGGQRTRAAACSAPAASAGLCGAHADDAAHALYLDRDAQPGHERQHRRPAQSRGIEPEFRRHHSAIGICPLQHDAILWRVVRPAEPNRGHAGGRTSACHLAPGRADALGQTGQTK